MASTATCIGRVMGLALLCGSLALGSCGGETSILLTVKGNTGGGQALKVRVIGRTGPLGAAHTIEGMGGKPLALPGTVLIKTNDGAGRLGVVVWVEDAAGKVVAHGYSKMCFGVTANVQAKYKVELGTPPFGWTSGLSDACSCDPQVADVDMCPPGGVPRTDGGAGSGGNAAGQGGLGGGAGMGGAAGKLDGGAAGAGGTVVRNDGGGATDGPLTTTDTAPVQTGTDTMPGLSGGLWGFEEIGGWTVADATPSADTAVKKEGGQSLSLAVTGTQLKLTSRKFSNTEIGSAPTAKLGVWIWLSTAPGDSYQPFFSAQIECKSAMLYGAYLDNVNLKTAGAVGMGWTRITFDVKPDVQAKLKTGQVNDCEMILQVNNAMGTVKLDGMAFDP